MNFTELNQKLGGAENQSDWRQASGGGWLHKSAKITDENTICDNAIVWGFVADNAQVFGNARVSGDGISIPEQRHTITPNTCNARKRQN